MTRTTWILVAILVVLIAVTVLVCSEPGEQSTVRRRPPRCWCHVRLLPR